MGMGIALLAALLAGTTACGGGGSDSWEGTYAGRPQTDELVDLLRIEKGDDGGLVVIELTPSGDPKPPANVSPASGEAVVELIGDKAIECNGSGLQFDGGGGILKVDPGCDIDGFVAKTGWVLVTILGPLELEKR